MTFSSGTLEIDAIAYSSWNASPHQAATVTYSFLTAIPAEATSEDATGFAPLNSVQRQAVRDALAQWSSVANITFVDVSDGQGGDNGQIRFGSNDQNDARSSGYSDLPSNGIAGDRVYTYFNNQDSDNFTFTAGSYGWTVFLHEIGHAIGLKHPGDYNGGAGGGTAPYLPTETDNTDYSLMSYNDGKSYAINFKNAASPMLYDIQAMQYLYGANTSWHTGADTYRFTNLTAPQCIWDAGGSNTFDFSATSQGAIIDLHAGAFSSSAPGLNNIAIAYGVTIQNAVGGTGDDVIYANDGTNTISAGAGNDLIRTGSGAETIDGGTGTDTVSFNMDKSMYQITRAANNNILIQNKGIAGNLVTVTNVETLSFLDVSISTSSIGGNTAPVVSKALGDVFAGLGKAFSLQVPTTTFTDADAGDALHYSATLVNGSSLPSWLSFDANTRTFSGTPGAAQLGTTYVRVTATDNAQLAVSSDFHISTVRNYGQQFNGTGANDQFTGTSELDVAVYDGNRANFTVTKTGTNTYTVVQAGGSTDTLVNVDRLKFLDATVAIDINDHGGQAYGLYQAAFNRTPDSGGLGYWINVLDTGGSLQDVTHAFITSPEFIATYNNLDTHGFVTTIYQNVLHRAPDAGGAAFWENGINSGATNRETVLLNFTQSVEFQGNLVTAVGNGFSYTPFLS